MADVTKSVIAGGGGDYTTVGSAEAASDVSTGWYKIEIQDNSTYAEWVNMSAPTGTPSATNYVWFTTATANRHTGQFSGTHARMKQHPSTFSAQPVINITVKYTRVDYMHFARTIGSSSYDLWAGHDGILISHCMFGNLGTTTTFNAIAVNDGDASTTISIDNCAFNSYDRDSILVQATIGNTITVNVDHCSVLNSGPNSLSYEARCIRIWGSGAGVTLTANLYNNAFVGHDPNTNSLYDARFELGSSATVVVNGSNNLHRKSGPQIVGGATDNTTSWQTASSGPATVTKTSGSWYVIVDSTANSDNADLTLLDEAAGNLAANNGTDRIGSEPDARQDFSVDIAGNTRDTTSVDIGAYVFVATALDDGWGRIPCF